MAAEAVKIRRTLALWLVSVLPAAPAGLQLLLQVNDTANPTSTVDPWLWLGYTVLVVWTMFVLPLFVALETGLLAGIEHGASGWKQLFSVPVRRGPVYAAKISMVFVLVAVAHAMLWLYTVLAGEIMVLFHPALGYTAVPPRELLLLVAVCFAGSGLMIAIHTFISLRWPSLVLNAGVAIMAMIVSLSMVESGMRRFYPWFIPAELVNGTLNRMVDHATPGQLVPSLLTGILGGAVLCLVAVFLLKRRDVV
jgi:hypothetical protein